MKRLTPFAGLTGELLTGASPLLCSVGESPEEMRELMSSAASGNTKLAKAAGSSNPIDPYGTRFLSENHGDYGRTDSEVVGQGRPRGTLSDGSRRGEAGGPRVHGTDPTRGGNGLSSG